MIKKEFIITTGSVDSEGDIILPSAMHMPKEGMLRILDHFDASRPVGVITKLKTSGNDCIATAMLNADPTGLTPAICFQSIKNRQNEHGGKTHEEIKLICVGLSPAPNTDPNVKPIQ